MARELATLFRFRGRSSRFDFWTTFIGFGLVFVVLFVFIEVVFARPATLILYPPLFWVALALGARRVHDRGRSAWWLLVVLIPILGPLWLAIELGFRAGTLDDNQYGPDPHARADYLTVK